MIQNKISFEFDGLKELTARLKALPDRLQLGPIVMGLGRAMRMYKKLIVGKAPERTGSLKQSINVRIRRYGKRNLVWSMVGARSGSIVSLRRPIKGGGYDVRPSKYLHLVDGTFKNRAGVKKAHRSTGFITATAINAQNAARSEYIKGFQKGFDNTIIRLSKERNPKPDKTDTDTSKV